MEKKNAFLPLIDPDDAGGATKKPLLGTNWDEGLIEAKFSDVGQAFRLCYVYKSWSKIFTTWIAKTDNWFVLGKAWSQEQLSESFLHQMRKI